MAQEMLQNKARDALRKEATNGVEKDKEQAKDPRKFSAKTQPYTNIQSAMFVSPRTCLLVHSFS